MNHLGQSTYIKHLQDFKSEMAYLKRLRETQFHHQHQLREITLRLNRDGDNHWNK
jgi:hypothetical protein